MIQVVECLPSKGKALSSNPIWNSYYSVAEKLLMKQGLEGSSITEY
jgi:hypothetical protein